MACCAKGWLVVHSCSTEGASGVSGCTTGDSSSHCGAASEWLVVMMCAEKEEAESSWSWKGQCTMPGLPHEDLS
eukprot:3752658-Rhodomonas_salina.1